MQPGTLASRLLAPRPVGPLQLQLTVGRRVLLQGAELEAFEAQRAAAEAAAAAAAAAAVASAADADAATGVAASLQPQRTSSQAISQVHLGKAVAAAIAGAAAAEADEQVRACSVADSGVNSLHVLQECM